MKRAVVLAALLAGCADNGPVQPLMNRCMQDVECAPQRCDQELRICTRDRMLRPYAIALQIAPDPATAHKLVSRYTVELGSPMIPDAGIIRVPEALVSAGQIEGPDRRTVEAELAFTADPGHGNTYRTAPLSVLTFPRQGSSNEQMFTASLIPGAHYDVRVYPRGRADSRQFPPKSFNYEARPGNPPFTYTEPLADFEGFLADETSKWVQDGLKVRLRDKATGLVVSTIGTTGVERTLEVVNGQPILTEQDRDGFFRVRTFQSVIDRLANYELVLGLEPEGSPWQVSIAFDGAELTPSGTATIVMPVLPPRVPYIATVDIPAEAQPVNALAQVTFTSSFPLPTGPIPPIGTDWCRLRSRGSAPSPFRCSATLTTSVGTDRLLTASLLPGTYDVYVVPTSGAQARRVISERFREDITPRVPAEPEQAGRRYTLSGPTLYFGHTFHAGDEATAQTLMPLVTVVAKALGVRHDLAEVARYNQTVEVVGDGRGEFALGVDTGYYDLLAIPPQGSNFPWTLRYYNRRVDQTPDKPFSVPISYPVVSRGKLEIEPERPLVGAQVDAFAVVPDLATRGSRLVHLARASSDESGEFALLLPPYIGDSPELDAPADGGVALDAAALSLPDGAFDSAITDR